MYGKKRSSTALILQLSIAWGSGLSVSGDRLTADKFRLLTLLLDLVIVDIIEGIMQA